MQIVIDIPDDMIKALEQGSFGAKYNMYDLVGCVMNGTPLDKIRAEIEQIHGNKYEVSDMQGNRHKYETIEKAEVLQIIDKYRESEG